MGVIIVIIILVLLMILLLKMTKKYRHNARKITFFFTGRASCTTFFGRQKRCLAHIFYLMVSLFKLKKLKELTGTHMFINMIHKSGSPTHLLLEFMAVGNLTRITSAWQKIKHLQNSKCCFPNLSYSCIERIYIVFSQYQSTFIQYLSVFKIVVIKYLWF